MGGRTFRLRIGVQESAKRLLRFHKRHLTEHLWPRTKEQFEKLIEDERLVELVEHRSTLFFSWLLPRSGLERTVGLAYVTDSTELDGKTERAEFGGIFIAEDCRGLGLANAVGIVAIANYFVLDPPKGRLVAHVHEFNELPRRVLEKQLGFRRNGEEIPPPDVAPQSMKRNSNGQVVGHLFEFQRATLSQFADWIGSFSGEVSGRDARRCALDIEVPSIAKNRAATLEALRSLAS